MLEDSTVLKWSHYWAQYYVRKWYVPTSIEYGDLISIAYIVGKPLRDERLLSKWIRFTLMRFIVDETKRMLSPNRMDKPIGHAGTDESGDEFIDVEDGTMERQEIIAICDDVNSALEKCGLHEDDKRMLYMRFFEGKTLGDIATEFDMTSMGALYRVRAAINKVGSYYKRMIR